MFAADKRIAAAIITAAVFTTAPAAAQNFDDFTSGLSDTFDTLVDLMPPGVTNVKLGAGAAYSPKYEGDNNRKVSAVPLISFRYRDIIAVDNNQIRINLFGKDSLFDAGALKAGPVLRVDFGRDANDSPDLTGLSEVSTSIELGGFVAYTYGPARYRLRVTQDVASGHGGAQATLDASVAVYRSSVLTTGARLSTTYAFNGYLDSYYSISAAQATASGLTAFDAGSGIKDVSFDIASEYRVTESWSAVGNVGFSRLLGDAAKNPLVETRGSANQISLGLFAVYTF